MKNTPPTSDFPSTPLALDDAALGPVEPDLAAVDGPIPLVTDKSEQLSPAQARAIEMLASGHTVATAAEAVGVGRTTIYRWLKGDAAFVAAFNAWQQDMLDTARGRLLALTDTPSRWKKGMPRPPWRCSSTWVPFAAPRPGLPIRRMWNGCRISNGGKPATR